MPPSPRTAFLLLVLAAGTAVRVGAAAAAAAGTPAAGGGTAAGAVPVDGRERWTVGIGAFRAEGLDPSDAWLAWSLPLLLRDRVAGLAEHALDAAGREALAQRAISRARADLLVSIAGLRDARDAAALGGTAAGNAAPAGGGTAALAEALARLDALDRLDPSVVAVPDRKPLAFKEGAGPGQLLAAPFGSRAEAAAREDVDLLVGGSVREAAGYLVVDVWAWDAARGAAVFTWRDAAAREELYARMADAGRGLAGVLLGRPWASLEVAVEPPAAAVLVDGRPPGTGRTRFDDLAPGPHEVRVTAPGRVPASRAVDLAAESETVLAVELAPEDLGTIAVTSEPPGADAWLDAVWQGRTPLAIPRPGERSRLAVALPDGPGAGLTVGPGSPAQVSFTLALDAPGAEADRKIARDRFYGAFGWLVLSLPVPFYAYSWAVDWAAEARRLAGAGDLPGAQHAVDVGTGFYVAYLVGLGVSATLGAWTVYRTVRYVAAADSSAARGGVR